MNTYEWQGLVLAFSEPMFFASMAAIFILLFVVIHRVLKEVSFFKGATAVIVALCVSLLSVIGLSQFIPGGDGLRAVRDNEGRTGGILDFILLLYAVLGIAIILLLFLKYIANLFRREEVKRYSKETKRGRKEHLDLFGSAREAREKSEEKTQIKK